MAYDKGNRPEGGFKRRGGGRRRKKVCVFCGKAEKVYFRERKDSSEKNYRKLCEAPESSYSSDQESSSYCFDAICAGVIRS